MRLWTLNPDKTPTGQSITVPRGAPETRDRASYASRPPPASERVLCWDGSRWIEYDALPVPFLDAAKAHYLSVAASVRWHKMTAGIEVGGAQIRTDPASQSLISGAVLTAVVAEQTGIEFQPIRFKAVNGWVTLGADDIKAVGIAVSSYVQDCYKREDHLAGLIQLAESSEELAEIQINDGWPDQV